MIDEERLDQICEKYRKGKLPISGLASSKEEMDLLRLARLGLWAEKYGVPALQYYKEHESVIKEAYHSNDERQITCVHTFINHKAIEALAALPKEEK